MFTQKSAARLAFKGVEWKGMTHHTTSLLDQLHLELVLDFIMLDLELWHWVLTHDLFDGLVGDKELSSSMLLQRRLGLLFWLLSHLSLVLLRRMVVVHLVCDVFSSSARNNVSWLLEFEKTVSFIDVSV